MRYLLQLLTLVAACGLFAGGALAAGRVALVIGNGDYQAAGTLANPVNDAHDIADKLRAIGFKVVDGYNLGKRDLEGKIGEFADKLDGADAGLFYYAGHGIAVDGHNFIVPTDAHLDIPAKLRLEAIPIDDVMELMQQQTKTTILILDACRNNPFSRGLRNVQVATRAVQVADGGLAQLDAARGTFIAFSTAPGAVAMDGTGRNSPFADALLKHLDEPGTSINDMMIEVRRDVVDQTKEFQNPMAWDSLTNRFEFVPGAPKAQPAAQPAQGQQQASLAPDPNLAIQTEVHDFITQRYLKPDAANLEKQVRELYTDPAISFGYDTRMDDLVKAKLAYFGKYQSWKLNFIPDSLKVSVVDESSVTATFDVRYRMTPKESAYSSIAGLAHFTLDLAKQGGVWKIEMENSRIAD